MHTLIQRASFAALLISILFTFSVVLAQSAGNSGTIYGTVTDPTGAVVRGATVSIENPVSGLSRQTKTDSTGHYQFTNLPLNPYHLSISATGFGSISLDADVRSTVPITLNSSLTLGSTSTVIEVTTTAGDLIENDPVGHTDVDRDLFQKLPLESQSSTLSSLVTLASPGIAADSNGLFHGLGDHASNSFSIDSQPVTDQQSKVFSNQLPSNSVQSLEVVDGAPSAEYGGKTSVVIVVTTRSGQGVTTPTGSVTTSFGTFGSSTASVDLSYGGKSWGNFIELDGINTGRFLDPPEFAVFHDEGNEFNVFDRIDRQLSGADSVHVNLGVSRSWFQTPNSFDNLNVQNVVSGGASANPVFGNVGNTDQRSKIDTFNIAPTYTHTISVNSVFNFTGYVRRDSYNYYPSKNPLADLGPIQNQTISQARSLTNAGVHTTVSYVKGINNIKIGVEYSQTFLRENDPLALINSTFNSPCVDENGNPLPGFTSPTQCTKAGDSANAPYDPTNPTGGGFNPMLLPYDLTRGGGYYTFNGHTDIKEAALYTEDQITAGDWTINAGLRGDLYNGLAIQRQAEPRMGVSYNIKKTNTILRTSYARTLESPFNENLVLSSQGCGSAVLAELLICTPGVSTTLQPGFRNELHAGLQQAIGKNFVISGDYIWKYTHNAFDFSVLGNTPITFPIDWHNSKIPGFDLRADVPHFHGVAAFVVMSSVAARFYPPQIAGAGATVGQSGYPFRIDHDERYNETAHLQYQVPGRFSPWFSFNWRFDSGLVAGSAPCYGVTYPNSPCLASSTTLGGQPAILMVNAVGVPFTADQEFQAGFACGSDRATPTNPLPTTCLASQFTSSLISIPAPNTGDNDHNPQRIAPRNVFDASLGQDNLFNGDKYKWSLHLTAVNFTDKYALYNFLSTFSGTHYLTPRALTAELGFHF
jgi:hypothetical protein